MKAITVRANAIGGTATAMNGRRRPIGVWNVSLHGPMTSGRVSAKIPSDARTAAISTAEPVNLESSGGRYAATTVIENASPNAPRPSDHSRFRRAAGTLTNCSTAASARCVKGR